MLPGDRQAEFWYACYGSNLSRTRFRTYLAGGIAPGRLIPNVGARDSTPPAAEERALILARLCFAGVSAAWGRRSVAFLEPAPGAPADAEPAALSDLDAALAGGVLLRLYRLTAQQGVDLFLQENGVDPTLRDGRSTHALSLPERSWGHASAMKASFAGGGGLPR